MKILFINYQPLTKTLYYRPGFFSRELAQRGYRVTIMCTSDTARGGIREYVENGVHYALMPDASFGRLRTGWDLWNLLNRMRYLQGKSFDLIHSFETRPATIHPVRFLQRKRPTPLVIDWIDWWGRGGLIKEHRPIWYQYLFGWLETFYEEHFRTLADGTTVISHALARRAESLGVDSGTIYWIPNGAPVDTFSVVSSYQHRTEFGLPQDAFIIADSALDVIMGVDMVMQALSLIVRSHPEVLLIMTGKKEKELQVLAQRYGVAGHFRHLGVLPYETLAKALSCADIFVMPYPDCVANRGRWPGRIGTYLALGRPIVSNPVGEVGMLFEKEAVGLLAMENAESVAENIIRLKNDPSLRERLGKRARQVAELMTWRKMTDKMEKCYLETVARFQKRYDR